MKSIWKKNILVSSSIYCSKNCPRKGGKWMPKYVITSKYVNTEHLRVGKRCLAVRGELLKGFKWPKVGFKERQQGLLFAFLVIWVLGRYLRSSENVLLAICWVAAIFLALYSYSKKVSIQIGLSLNSLYWFLSLGIFLHSSTEVIRENYF